MTAGSCLSIAATRLPPDRSSSTGAASELNVKEAPDDAASV